MKTISDYKTEFIQLMQELEKEHGCVVKSIYIEQRPISNIPLYSDKFSTTTCKIDIQ